MSAYVRHDCIQLFKRIVGLKWIDNQEQYIFTVADMVIHCSRYGFFRVADVVCGRYVQSPLQ